MIVVEQLSILDLLGEGGLSRERERDWHHVGPAVRLLRATVRSITGDCRAIGVDASRVLGPLQGITDQAYYCDSRHNVKAGGERVVEAWEHGARDRLRAARLQLEDDQERGRTPRGRTLAEPVPHGAWGTRVPEGDRRAEPVPPAGYGSRGRAAA